MKALNAMGLVIILGLSGFYCSQSGSHNNQNTIGVNVNRVEFDRVETGEPDSVRTLQSLKREGELFMITYYGDYDSLLEDLNERIINEGIDAVVPSGTARFDCSIFAAMGDPEHPVLGRNFDNNVDRGVLVGLYSPPNGYRSVAASRLSDMGFDRGEDPTSLPLAERQILLNSVFFPTDGMNDQGISIALATGVNAIINRDGNRQLIFITYLLREVLDLSANLEEAIQIVRNHDVFDVDTNTVSNHLLIADPDGNSVIAEYYQGDWRFICNDRPWQIVTNTLLYNVSEDVRRNQCSRYRTADDALQQANGRVSWQEGMNILESISNRDTQWSSLYDLNGLEVYLSLYRDYVNIFQVGIH